MSRSIRQHSFPLAICLLPLLLTVACGENEEENESSRGGSEVTAVEDADVPAAGDAQHVEYPTAGDILPAPFETIWSPRFGDFDDMVERRVIRVAVPFGGYQFYYANGKPRGAIYELVQRLEGHINDELARRNVRVFVVMFPVSRDQLIPSIINGNADIVAADLTITPERSMQVDFGRPLRTKVNEVIVTGRGAPKLDSMDDLSGKEVFVRRSSSYFEHLQKLNADLEERGLPPAVVRAANELLEAEDILEMLDGGLATVTVLDDYKAMFWSEAFPNITVRDDLVLSAGSNIAWAVRKDSPELLAVTNGFLKKFGNRTMIGNDTFNRYLADSSKVRCTKSGLGNSSVAELAGHFQKFGGQYDFDWLMLAAQGLQESGLRQDRKSAAGAVGVMQIKPSTAAGKHIGIDDVSTAESNIHAGAKYLRFVADRYFSGDNIEGLNTWFFSLAAYNAGPAKINRYRKEASEKGYDSDIWFDNVEIIAARRIGRETVDYVSNIFKYYVGYQLARSRVDIHEKRFGEFLTSCSVDGE